MAELEWLGVVRHGESTGNLAASRAEADRLDLIDIPERDADVPLSNTGRDQAAAVARWLARLDAPPEIVVVSPYLRAIQTAEIAVADSGIELVRDERLRDRELGIIDLHTTHGIRSLLPAEAERRDYADRRVLLFSHEAVVLLLRYLIEGLTEAELIKLVVPITNGSITTWQRGDDDKLSIVDFNRVDHLRREGAEPTREAEVSAEPV
jgi:2,3-bisphosphoglycerate-dependent phosphoglycerate mutase